MVGVLYICSVGVCVFMMDGRANTRLTGWPVLRSPSPSPSNRQPDIPYHHTTQRNTYQRQVENARAVLQAVREKSGDRPDEVLVNIAHLFTAQVGVHVPHLVGRFVGLVL